MPVVRARAIISGRVQGVFFRAHTRDFAKRYGVKGWVKNRPDGAVEAVFEGKEDDVRSMLDWCNDGPPGAKVTGMDVKWEPSSGGFEGFEIVY